MTDTITRFSAGAPVPEWLLVAEPMAPHAPRGAGLRFAVDAYALDLPEAYLVVAVNAYGASIFDAEGMAGHRIYAPGDKPVGWVTAMQSVQPLAVDAWTPARGAVVVQAPEPKRGFWARLRYVLRGR